MAGSQVEVLANAIDKQRLGYMAISLTNYDADTEPQIAAGSKAEIAGALFEFTALESITGWGGIGNNNDVWAKLVVSGTSVTAEFTTTAPTWDTAKQGWYGTGGAALHRYVAKLRKDGSGNYTDKGLLQGGPDVRNAALGAAAVRTLQIQDAAVTRAKILNAAVNAAKVDTTLTAGGSQTLAISTPWVIPAGIYVFATIAGSVALEVYVSGAWHGDLPGAWSGGVVISDGANVRLNPGASTDTVYYRKLA